ncbi:hypothetical protein D9757_000751 [Collybiopsis confluens]|uniref:General transcription and DNA repair factor IIH subunit TFB4 n=1 Tax=Collybiopsis confluens TaxID=2823264 RepID=A0A8H5I1G3_9AGAR|nr:hypothetical protein D9757_000751 [Collybiopsis confluens]
MNSSHLSVVVDLAPAHWHRSSLHTPSILDLPSFISQLLAFLNAHIAARHENTLAVFGAFPGESVLLYSSSDPPADYPPSDANSFPPFKMVNSIIIRNILSHLESSTADEQAPSALVSALIKALCYINRLTIEFNASTSNAAEGLEPLALPDPRILILSVSPDQTASYIPVMNSIFSAQKLKVTIDACQLFGPETVFLQQAAHLTGGSYIYLERRDALLQYLTMAFLPSPAVRETISVPTQDKIDFRAACFCHKNIVDVGFNQVSYQDPAASQSGQAFTATDRLFCVEVTPLISSVNPPKNGWRSSGYTIAGLGSRRLAAFRSYRIH